MSELNVKITHRTGDYGTRNGFYAAADLPTSDCVYFGPWTYYFTLTGQGKTKQNGKLVPSAIAAEVRASGTGGADTVVVDEDSATYALLGCSPEAAARVKTYNDDLNARVDRIRITTRESVVAGCSFKANASFQDTKEWDIKYAVMNKGGNVYFVGSDSRVVTGSSTDDHRTIYGETWSDTTTTTTHTVSGEVYKCN